MKIMDRKLQDLGLKNFIDMISTLWFIKKKNWTAQKFKTFFLQAIPWRKLKNKKQKPLQYCKVISLQLIKINGEKKKVDLTSYTLKKNKTKQAASLEKIGSKPLSIKELTSRIYIELLQFNNNIRRKINQSNNKQQIWIKTSTKKIYKWKLRSQSGNIQLPLEWL